MQSMTRVFWIDIYEFAQDRDRRLDITASLIVVGNSLILPSGINEKTLSMLKIGQAFRDLERLFS
jgi:hypothetical protein